MGLWDGTTRVMNESHDDGIEFPDDNPNLLDDQENPDFEDDPDFAAAQEEPEENQECLKCMKIPSLRSGPVCNRVCQVHPGRTFLGESGELINLKRRGPAGSCCSPC